MSDSAKKEENLGLVTVPTTLLDLLLFYTNLSFKIRVPDLHPQDPDFVEKKKTHQVLAQAVSVN